MREQTPREGPASGSIWPRTRFELIFDPHTYRFIGSQATAASLSGRLGKIARAHGYRPGTVLLASHLLKVSFTNTAPTRYTMSSARFAISAPTGPGSRYLPSPPPHTWGPVACIFGPNRFY